MLANKADVHNRKRYMNTILTRTTINIDVLVDLKFATMST